MTDEEVIEELRQRAISLTERKTITGAAEKLSKELGYDKHYISKLLSGNLKLSAGIAEAAGYKKEWVKDDSI